MTTLDSSKSGQRTGVLSPTLRIAAQTGSQTALLACIRRGDDLNARDDKGRSAWMIAASRGHAAACELLEAHGAWPYGTPPGEEQAAASPPAEPVLPSRTPEPIISADAKLAERETVAEEPEVAYLDSADEWESEEDAALPAQDADLVEKARALQDRISSHVAVDDDEDWMDVLVDLPAVFRQRRGDHVDPGFLTFLGDVFGPALDTGCLDPDQLRRLLVGSPLESSPEDDLLVHQVATALSDLGVVVEEGAWQIDEPALPGSHASSGYDSSEIEDAAASITSSITGRDDPLWLFAREMQRAGALLTPDEEVALGKRMDAGLEDAAVHALCDPSTAANLVALIEAQAAKASVSAKTAAADSAEPEEDDPGDHGAPEDLATQTDLQALLPNLSDLFGRLEELEARRTIAGQLKAFHIDRNTLRVLMEGAAARLDDQVARTAISNAIRMTLNARSRLVERNLRLAWSVARKYNYGAMPLADLLQEANAGLMKAADRFDAARGFRFSTYATWWVRQSVSRGIAESARLIRIPVHMHERHRHLQRAIQELGHVPVSEADHDRLARLTDLTAREVRTTLAVPPDPLSLDTDEEARLQLSERGDWSQDPATLYEAKATRMHAEAVLAGLKRKEAMILRMRYGVGLADAYTLEEIGNAMEVTRERIRQIESKTMTVLKKRCATAIQPGTRRAPPEAAEATGQAEVKAPPPAGSDAAAGSIGPAQAESTDPLIRALQMLSSEGMQLAMAEMTAMPSPQRVFAQEWFAAYNPIDPAGRHTRAQHQAFQSLSAALRAALRHHGFGPLPIRDLHACPLWRAAMTEAANLIAGLHGETH